MRYVLVLDDVYYQEGELDQIIGSIYYLDFIREVKGLVHTYKLVPSHLMKSGGK